MMLIIMMFLHVATVLAKGNISCSIPAVKPMETTSLTCVFPEDLSQSKKDFSIHIANSTSKPVLDCLWAQGKLECFTSLGFEFNMTVTDKLTMWIPRVFPNMTGEYYCKLADSTGYDIQHCHLVLTKDQEEETNLMAILVPVILTVSVAIVLVLVFLMRRFLTTRQTRIPKGKETEFQEPVLEEELAMISTTIETQNEEEYVDVTQMFEEYIKIKFGEMYPKEAGPFYFVPPVYFNKVRYKKKPVAGQVIYVPNSTDPIEVRHDQAMRYILHCLHRIVEKKNEDVFVLTQFQYEDFLNNPGDAYKQHHLPMPSDLTGEDKTVGCFDILIIHRDHGIVLGVVKAVSDKDVDLEGQNRYQKVDEIIVREVTEAVKQLRKSDRIIRHLLSDHQQFPTVRMTLILPNLTRSSLRRAVATHKELLKEMRDILAPKVENDPLDRCLCAMEVLHKEFLKEDNIIYNTRILLRLFIDPLDDHGYYVKTPAELKFDFFTCMRQWWQSTMSDTDGDMRMTPELYHSMLSRFCGPATQPAAEGQEEPYLLPKTLAEAVSLTGDLYERVMLYQDMTCLQKEERLFLAGPLNTCKTLMLTLAGEKWLSEGHNVYVICDPSVPRDSVMSAFLDQFSHMTNSRNQTIENYAFGSVHEISCNFKTKKERNETVDTLINKRETALCILAYEVGVAGKSFKDLCKRLESQRSDVRLWATAISDKAAPDDWKLFTFQQVLNCPPAVVREASSQELSFADESQAMPYLFPTDGPPVKYITHKIEHCKNCCDCTECGRKVADFLLKHLIIRNEKRGTLEEDRLETSTTIKLKELSLLREKDLLILFEDGKRQRLQFLRGLSEYGITATFIAKEDKKIITAIIDDAWAMNVDLVDSYRPRRKIVVFVESVMGRKDIRTKQKAVKCCNSQLIIVQHNH